MHSSRVGYRLAREKHAFPSCLSVFPSPAVGYALRLAGLTSATIVFISEVGGVFSYTYQV
jgi:hypothetical protein